MQRIGIYAGSFDPIHNGHLAFAAEAARLGKLEKVFFLVEPTPRRKQGVKAFQHRVKMVKLAIEPFDNFGLVVTEQQQFTISETLPHLLTRFKGARLVMLMGEDWLGHITGWPHVDGLAASADLLVGVRKLSIKAAKDLLKQLEQTRGMHFEYQIIQTHDQAVNSSSVRTVFRKGQVSSHVPPEVAQYIKRHKLYSSSI